MYFMNVQTLVLAQQGNTDCIQQLFNYCQRFLTRPNSIVQSKRFQSTIRFYPGLTLEDVRQDLLVSSVDKVIKHFDHRLLGNDIEAFIRQSIKFCANNWLRKRNCSFYSPHNIVDGEVRLINHDSLSVIIDGIEKDQEFRFSEYFKESGWNPEQEFIYNSICKQTTDLVVDYLSVIKSNRTFGTGLSSKVSMEEYLDVYRLIFLGEKRGYISKKMGIELKIISRFHHDILNPIILLAVDDRGIYEQYLPKLNPKALKLIKNKKGLDFLRSYDLL